MTQTQLQEVTNNITEIHENEGDSIENMYLTFKLGNEVYGICVVYVTEIVGVPQITKLPDMPNYIKGVVNLRGQIIPVVDMRLRFDMASRDYDERTCIIVINIDATQQGLVVDTVNEVMTIDVKNISPPPQVGSERTAHFIKGMARVGDDVKILLDGKKLLLEEELPSTES